MGLEQFTAENLSPFDTCEKCTVHGLRNAVSGMLNPAVQPNQVTTFGATQVILRNAEFSLYTLASGMLGAVRSQSKKSKKCFFFNVK